jgi:ComEC/Rec2-related protein
MKSPIIKSIQLIPPILPLLLAYIASSSLFWGVNSEIISWGSVLFCGISCLVATAIMYKKLNIYTLSFIIAAALLGLLRNHQTVSYYQAFPFNLTEKGASIQSMLQSYSFHPTARLPFCNTILLHKIISTEGEFFTSYRVQIYTKKKLPADIGDMIEIQDIALKKPNNHSFYSYLMKEGIAATAFKDRVNIIILSHDSFSLSRCLFNMRESILKTFQQSLNKQTFSLFAAIFLGERELIKRNKESLEGSFKKWGIVHYLARSGLHLVLIVSLCEFLLRCIPIAFMLKQIILLLAVMIYFFLTWPSISFIRALLIFLMYTYYLLFRTPNHFLHMLLLCCSILLVINPLYILFLDFQLSFGLTFALAWLNLFRTVLPTDN